jgi:hypothetical protein
VVVIWHHDEYPVSSVAAKPSYGKNQHSKGSVSRHHDRDDHGNQQQIFERWNNNIDDRQDAQKYAEHHTRKTHTSVPAPIEALQAGFACLQDLIPLLAK